MKKNLLLLLLIFFSCNSLPDNPENLWNPLDPMSPNYTLPTVTIIQGPNENEILTSDSVLFSWQGNSTEMEYRYKLDNIQWSDFTNTTNVEYDLLDDEQHNFHIQSRYKNGAESAEVVRNFIIDAIQPNALYLYPKKVVITAVNTFNLELMVDVKDSISAISSIINFEPASVNVEEIKIYDTPEESFLLKNGGSLIKFKDFDNINGKVEINLTVVEGTPRNVIGNGKIAKIRLKYINGNTRININNYSELRNYKNEVVAINNFISSYIFK